MTDLRLVSGYLTPAELLKALGPAVAYATERADIDGDRLTMVMRTEAWARLGEASSAGFLSAINRELSLNLSAIAWTVA
jgi:hypothetical protein